MRSGGANVGNVGLPAATVHFGIERDLLTFGQARHASSLEGGGVNKDVRSSVIRLDKTVALLRVVKLHNARLHRVVLSHLSRRAVHSLSVI